MTITSTSATTGQERCLVASAILLVAAIVAVLFFWHPRFEEELLAPSAPTGGDFRFLSADGEKNLHDFSGQVVLLYFGYTYCPDICPTALSTIAGALEKLNANERRQVKVLFVSVDPERDTLPHLSEYVRFFHPDIVSALVVPPGDLPEVAKRYGVFYQRVPGQTVDYAVDHSADTLVLDQTGKMVGSLPHGVEVDTVVDTLRRLL